MKKKSHNLQIISKLVATKLLRTIALLMRNFIVNFVRILGICKDFAGNRVNELGKNYTLDCIKKNPRFSISIISEDTAPMIISSFGFQSSRDADKYADFGYDELDGTPAVRGSFCGRLILDAVNFIDCGTHVIVIGKLVGSYSGSGTPMTYAYYHRVIKGNAPKNAPTYRAPQESESVSAKQEVRKFKCDVCGYVVESEKDLPADFVCPVCGVDRSHFYEI